MGFTFLFGRPAPLDAGENDHRVSLALRFGDLVTIKLLEARNLQKADFWTGETLQMPPNHSRRYLAR